MSAAVNHMKRSHRSNALRRGAFGHLSRQASIRDSGSYSGKGLAGVLNLFHRRILESRKKPDAGTEAEGE